MAKLNLKDAVRVKNSLGNIIKLKGQGFSWSR